MPGLSKPGTTIKGDPGEKGERGGYGERGHQGPKGNNKNNNNCNILLINCSTLLIKFIEKFITES